MHVDLWRSQNFNALKMEFMNLHVEDMVWSMLIGVNTCFVEVLMELCGVLRIDEYVWSMIICGYLVIW